MRRNLAFVLGISLFAPVAQAENWPQWRGPEGNGVAPGTGYPVQWSETENVAWKVELPGPGASTPAVWDDAIFVTCGSQDGKNLLVQLDRGGRQRWQAPIGDERSGRNSKATGSNPSPTTDGELIFCYFKSGDLACVDFSGRVHWQKNLQSMYGEDKLWWDLGTSPVLTKDLVVVAHMHGGPSYLAAFDKQSGKPAWKADRTLNVPLESNDSYTTPVVVRDGRSETIVTLGADHVTAHDAQTGREVWRVGGLNPTQNENFRSISSPVISQGLVIAPYSRGGTLTAIKLGGSGDVTGSHVAWIRDRVGADVPTPVALGGKLYVARDHGDRGRVLCLDAKTGKTIWEQRLPKGREDFTSSPILADGMLYLTREDGATYVLDTAAEGKLLASNSLAGEFTVATPVFAGGRILIRTRESLYAIEGR